MTVSSLCPLGTTDASVQDDTFAPLPRLSSAAPMSSSAWVNLPSPSLAWQGYNT